MGAVRELIAKFESEADNSALKTTDSLMDRLAKKSGVVGSALKDLFRQDQAAAASKKAKAAFDGLDEQGKAVLAAAVAAEDAAKIRADAASASLKGVAGVAATALGAIGAFAHSFVAEAETLQYTSDGLRTTTHDLQVMGAVGRSVGLDMNATAGILRTLRTKVDEAARGIGDGGYTFRRLGVQVRDANRQVRPLSAIFGDVATGISRVTKQSRQMILTERLLGTEGRRFISLFAGGKDALADFAAVMEDSGGGISQESIDAGLKLSRAWNIAGLSMDSLKSRVAMFLLPALEKLVRFGTKVLNFFNKTTIAENGLKIATVALAAAGARAAIMWAVANAPLVAQFALIAAAVGVVVIVVDDLINLFSGGQSVIGDFIDELFGVGTAADVVKDIKAKFDDFMFTIREVKREVSELWDSFHIGHNARTDPRNQASRTRIRGLPQTPAVAPAALNGADAAGAAHAARILRMALQGRPGAASITVPAPATGTPARGRGAPGINVPIPPGSVAHRGTTEVRIHSQPVLHLAINNPTGDGAQIGRAATPAIRRAMADGDHASVQALRDSGMVTFQTDEPE